MEIKEIDDSIKNAETQTSENTKNRFGKHLEFIQKQHDYLLDFLVNFAQSGANLRIDDNAFLIVFALFADCVRKERICMELLAKGYYEEVGSIVRAVFQNCSHILYIRKRPLEWEKWVEHNNHQEDVLLGKQTLTPDNVFDRPYERFLRLVEMEIYYPLFVELCSYSHASSEVLRANFTPLIKSGGQINQYLPRYDEQKAEFLLNVLYGLINIAFWNGLANVILFARVPESIRKYQQMQDEATRCFDKFYSIVNPEPE